MKKTIRILSLTLAVLMLAGTVLTLVACGNKLSGEYVVEDDSGMDLGNIILKFSGDTVTIKGEGELQDMLDSAEGSLKFKYKIVDMTDEEKEENEGYSQKIQIFFEEGEDPSEAPFSKSWGSITIDGVKLKKK